MSESDDIVQKRIQMVNEVNKLIDMNELHYPSSFARAYQLLFSGFAIKRAVWYGYWVLNPDGQIAMHCQDGTVVTKDYDLQESLFNACASDWIALTADGIAKWDAIHAAVREGKLKLPEIPDAPF